MQKPNTPHIPKRVQQPIDPNVDADAVPSDAAPVRIAPVAIPSELAKYVREVYGASWSVVWVDSQNARIRNKKGETLKFSHGGRYQ